jgi:L-fuculose-phosphate aldolase
MRSIEQDLRERLVKIGKQMFEAGLTYSTAGNISAWIPNTNTCIISRAKGGSSLTIGNLKPEDFIIVNINTREVVSGKHRPSIETPVHTTIYTRRRDVGSVVHTHSHYATLFSIAGVELVPIGMGIARTPALAKGVGIAEYASPGTEELAINIAEKLRDRCAVLMPHHGVTVIGKTIEEAYHIAKGVEDLAKLQFEVTRIGKPQPLPKDAIKRILERGKKRGSII